MSEVLQPNRAVRLHNKFNVPTPIPPPPIGIRQCFPKICAIISWNMALVPTPDETGFMQQKLAPMRYLEIFDQVHAPTFHHLLRSLILRFLTEDVRYRIYSAPLDTITNIKMHRTASFKGEESIRCNERLYFTIRDDSSIDLSQSGGTLAPILRLFQIKWEEKVDNVNNSVAGTLQLKVPDLRFQEAYCR